MHVTKSCAECGADFVPPHHRNKYCALGCRRRRKNRLNALSIKANPVRHRRYNQRRHANRKRKVETDPVYRAALRLKQRLRHRRRMANDPVYREKRRADKRTQRTRKPLFYIWKGIQDRCLKPRTQNYHHYGARGIKVLQEWAGPGGYARFARWIDDNLGPRPSPKHSLDRIDNDGHYEPGNLRWADAKTQATNRRTVSQLQARIRELEIRLLMANA